MTSNAYLWYGGPMKITEVMCKSILNRSGIPSVDYVVNPYMGCGHGCRYCYAVFMKRFAHEAGPWGSFVRAKVNAPEVLAKQIRTARPGLVNLSSVTDPYQPAERKYEISRRCLEVLASTDFEVSILTKSDLVLRDLDVLEECNTSDIGITITTLDNNVRRVFEPGSPSISKRLEALEKLNERGFPTWIFFGPVLPFISDDPEVLRGLFSAFSETGTTEVLVDSLNFKRGEARSNIFRAYEESFPDLLDDLRSLSREHDSYRERLHLSVLEAAGDTPLEISFCY